jgi:hypothetical protein
VFGEQPNRGPVRPIRTAGSRTGPGIPDAGEILYVTRAASVQFVVPIYFRVIRALDWVTYDGWCWLDGYQFDGRGDAVERRKIWVQLHGLRWIRQPPAPRRSSPRGNRGRF